MDNKLKILLVGANGTVGRAVAAELSARHEIVSAGRASGDVRLDMSDAAGLRRALSGLGRLDAIVAVAGDGAFGPLEELTAERYAEGLRSKLMGQVNLVTAGRELLRDGGSFTLTSGILSEQPIRGGSSLSMINGAIEAFARAAAIELPRGLRINAVSPGLLTESAPALGPFFRGFETVPASRVALAYSRSVEGRQTGQVYRVY
jgi:NAD(P)-dependent dehydrogenase (short-subunit alcohol dehydrogenase family)